MDCGVLYAAWTPNVNQWHAASRYFLNRDLISSLPLLHGMDDRIVLAISQKLRREVRARDVN